MTTHKSGVTNSKNMHILKKRLILITGLLMLMCAFTSHSNVDVTILADDDYPPYSYLENGEVKGIYIDLLRRASTQLKLDYHVKIISTPWKRALLTVKKGDVIGVVPPYLHYDSRPFISSYSVALGTEFVVTYCRENVDLKAALNLDLPVNKPVHLGMNAGYLLLDERYKQAIARGRIQLWENKSTAANVIKLLTNKIDCYVNDRKATQYELNSINKTYPQYNTVTVIEKDELSHRTAHIGFSREFSYPYKDDFIKRMNRALLDVMNETGKVKE
ncbi:transporter substrate-binding domain-containing protein [Pseudoalteromonas sp. NEC-BIFX-2020_015]|uniref:substrate-binding periplasmic protein n=1 Tax=Pseudoalteromonas sp. NEC-BIFX-2020_015 TaxID=2729544 RepID=UPI0014614DA5|nr:transporter substrate-binding domain-containing protein [Pseudoalteromonas sp. NEC-BIFX-2020_015]NMR24306.1 transporter substrate-binding domain-containing protein [Pseudoalteromonas sp. NEC-BIFX-2020_015]